MHVMQRIYLKVVVPTRVMVWVVVAYGGSKSTLVFIEEDVKVNTQVYIKS